jgi:Fe2+ or Zn2+ uptake regulation protein
LPEKRKHALVCLLESNTPLSVYEIAGAHNKVSEKSMTIMSVYLILELFEVKSLVNKFNSANEYVACRCSRSGRLIASDAFNAINHGEEIDAHAWQSFDNIRVYIQNITHTLITLRPQHSANSSKLIP